ncbi:hypothetical protein J5N97_019674 [Dioscorea zingiberensis]|uniref:DUF7356 domain-containing protein n=1 Tax=Dioscorea zingiberensis TaxID=325984 RepID=A0A9D5HCX8_9LILI|nr:hypothetical protein J5N97_019674 [Dioscorea zingiberensis]
MKAIGASFSIVFLLLLLLLNRFSCATETNGDQTLTKKTNPVKDLNTARLAPPDPGKGGEVKKVKDESGGSGEQKKKPDEKSDPKGSVSEGKDKPQEESGVKSESENGGGEDVSDSKTVPLKNSHVECDPSDQCNDEKNKFVACLRVPGEDSLSLSLLIQNKGTQSLTLNLIAPDSVKLEQPTVEIPAKQDKEVSVSVKDGANDAMIQLKAGTEMCTLHYQNTNSNTVKKNEASILSRYITISTHTAFIYLIIIAAVIISAVWLCMRFRWMNQLKDGPEYQKMEMSLPVSNGGKKEADDTDGWDKSWGDNWDDEEAPMTPSKPASTPSSKGLASRRFNKDGWKD